MLRGSGKGKYASPDGSKTWEYLAIATTAMSGFIIGTTLGWISPSVVKLMEPDSPVPFTPEDISTMAGAGGVGQLIGPLVANIIVDKFGRRSTMLIAILPVVLSSAMIMLARHVWTIHISRVLAGFAFGMAMCITPMYVGEIASVQTRGISGSVIVIMVNVGILFSFGICPYLSVVNYAGVLMTIGIIFEVSFWFMPETPHYLVMAGRFEEAESTLEQLRGKTDVKDELETITELIPKDNNNKLQKSKPGTIRDIFTDRTNRRALGIVLSFLIPQYFGLFFTLIAYGELIFRAAGSTIPSHLAALAIGVTQILSVILSGVLIDRLGRKPLVLASSVVAGLANFVIGAILFAKEYMSYDVSAYGTLFLVAVLVQVFAFNSGLLNTHMVISSEIFATDVKGISMCVVGVSSGIVAALMGKLYIELAITWGFGHSVLFLAGSIIVWGFAVLIFYIAPETKGKTFAQIQQELNR